MTFGPAEPTATDAAWRKEKGATVTDTEPRPEAEASASANPLERVEKLLAQWRGDIDELAVQLDIASKDVRDELCRRLEAAQNAELAARSRLGEVREDLVAALDDQRDNIVKILRDIRLMFESAREAAGRHGAGGE